MTDRTKRYRRLRNVLGDLLQELDEMQKEEEALSPAPEGSPKKKRADKYEAQFEGLQEGKWRKPAHLKKKK